ncbi:MAG: hypothetical protein ACKPGI_15065, partial [Verrucomicrobiota bacterium]
MTRFPGPLLALPLTATALLGVAAAPPREPSTPRTHGRHVIVTMGADTPVPMGGLPGSVRLRSQPSASTWVI